jgi:glucosamine-6-phosphate deaminase
MKIYVVKDYEEASRSGARIIADQIKEKKDSVLGLATGSSPLGIYEILVEKCKKGEISFKDISTVNLDEYKGLNELDKNSYHYYMNENLFSKVDIKTENIYLPNGMALDLDKECERYEKVIEDIGGIDLQLLGLGENGHIGFNEPGTPFTEKTHVVDLTESTIQADSRLFEKIEDVPRQALSMGIATIMSAKKILLIATGEKKADALAKVVNGKVTEDLPGSVLQNHKDVTIICDEAAAAKL